MENHLSIKETINSVNKMIAIKENNISCELLLSISYHLKKYDQAYEEGRKQGRKDEIEKQKWENAVFNGEY